ncbi:sensor histidine kinase [Halobacteriales archaeon QS_9_70_65]|nr:MAG: sensor histidine kinase [Halobacteriales archaeon QS_9_70_65]
MDRVVGPDDRHSGGVDGTAGPNSSSAPVAVAAFGAVLFAADVGAALVLLGPDGIATADGVVGRLVAALFCGGIVAGGYRLGRSDLRASRHPRVAGWVVAAAAGFLALGLVVGLVEGRAVERAVAAERALVEAERAESQQQRLEYLNGLLRHEVLNNAGIIKGYAELLLNEEELPASARASVDVIRRQSDEMTDVIQDVRTLVQAADVAETTEPVDVTAALEDELAALQATHPAAETDLQVDGAPYVAADDLLSRAFSNLLSNAVEHDPADDPTVSVTVTTAPERVRIVVADDGPGVPAAERAELFEPGEGGHGFGLYLVRMLVRRYGGEVELSETGPDGSVFAVDLPRAEPPAGDAGEVTTTEAATTPG